MRSLATVTTTSYTVSCGENPFDRDAEFDPDHEIKRLKASLQTFGHWA